MKIIIQTFKTLIILLFSSFLLLSCSQKPERLDYAVVSGSIIDRTHDTVSIEIKKNIKGLKNYNYQAEISNSGKFELKIPIKYWNLCTLTNGQKTIDLFLEPGDSIHLQWQDEYLNITGKGSENTNYFNLSYSKFENRKALQDNRIKTQSITDDFLFKEYRDSIKSQHLKFYNSNKEKLSNNAKKVALAQIINRWANKLFDYPTIHLFLNKKELTPDFKMGYHDFIKNIDLNDSTLLKFDKYRTLIDNYLDHQLKLKFQYKDLQYDKLNTYDTNHKYRDLYLLADTYLNGKIKEAMQSYYLVTAIERGRYQTISDQYNEFVNNVHGDYKMAVVNTYSSSRKVSKGHIAPDFTLESIAGENVKLSDFKGNVVYIDFWASWCAPCIKLIPESKKLKSIFKGEEIVFLNISIDNNEEVWKKTVRDKNIAGINVIAPERSSEVIDIYNAHALPRYYLIEKNGYVVDTDARKPDDPILINQLKELLNK